jgi:hypothetical protein
MSQAVATKPLTHGAPAGVSAKYSFVPTTEAELEVCLQDPLWRLFSGQLYQIMIKEPEGADGLPLDPMSTQEAQSVIAFRPNRSQRRFMERLWHRNIILKARQLGFTTLIAIMWLDHALFNPNQRCGIVAHNENAGIVIFRDKVRLAYDYLPAEIRARMPLKRDPADELLFAHNNSSVRVATSMRSGTIHRLHISEFGKICALYPLKAREVVSGTLPSVPMFGIAVIESTAEGQDGAFYTMTQRAIGNILHDENLTPKQWRFHFFAWWKDDKYRMVGNVPISSEEHDYFKGIESKMRITLNVEQRNWYIATRDEDFSGDHEVMWQEYPSTPEEAFQVSTEGKYYNKQMAKAREEGRIGFFPMLPNVAVDTYWDIGHGDGTGIWLGQRVGGQDRWIKYIEGWGEGYMFFIRELLKVDCVWGTHWLPHDADHKRQDANGATTPKEQLQKLPITGKWEVVDRVDLVQTGIQQVRDAFPSYVFDETGCKEGIAHIENYSKTWNEKAGRWSDTPRHDVHSECADALRQHAQSPEAVAHKKFKPAVRNWRTA